MKKPINPFSAIAECLNLLRVANPTALHSDQAERFDDCIRQVNEAAAELQAYLDDTGSGLFGRDELQPSMFDRDGVGGDGGSLPDGWSLLDGTGPKVVRDEDGLTLANAYVLRAVLGADPAGENVQIFDVAADEAFNVEAASANLDPTWGIVIHYVGEGAAGSACVAREYDPDRKAKEPEVETPAPAPEPEPDPAPEPAPESVQHAEAQHAEETAYDPNWTGYDEDPKNWTPEQTQTFDEWFDGLPEGAKVEINHAGVRAAFTERRDAAPAPQEGGQDAQVEGGASTETTTTAEAAPDAAPAAETTGKPKK